MRVGLLYNLGPDDFAQGFGYDEALSQVELADSLGIDHVLFGEHHGTRGCPAAGPLVTAAAARTSAIRVGVANRQLTLDYPVNTAEDFAVADIISRGRLILGVSPGERQSDFSAAGVEWTERTGRFREAVGLLRALWTQGPVQFTGDFYNFPLGVTGEPGWRREPYEPPYRDQWRRGQVRPEHLPMLPRPVQLPHPPIWVSAWDRPTIEWAASSGLGLLVSSLESDEEVRTKVGWYDAALTAAGRDRCEVDVALSRETFLAADGDAARETAIPQLRELLGEIRAERIDEQADLAIMGDVDVEKLIETCFLVGSPHDVLDRLLTLRADCGIGHLLCRVHLPGRAYFDTTECIRLLAGQLATRLVA